MGQALSFHELQDCVRRDFSDRALVSHGLFRSAYPRGTHFMCEMDLVGKVASKTWNDEEAELVIQAVKGFNFSGIRELSNQTWLSSSSDGDAKSVGFTSWSTNHLDLSENKGNALDVSARDSSGSDLHDGSRSQTFDALILKIIAHLAPGVSVEAVSFRAIVDALYQLHSANREESIQKALYGQNNIEEGHKGAQNITAVRNPNIVPLVGAFKGDGVLYLVYPPAPYTLESILHFSPKALDDDWNIRFLVFQLLSGLEFCHSLGIVHGDLKPSNILLTDTLWCWITGFHMETFGNTRKNVTVPSLRYLAPKSSESNIAIDLSWDPDFCNWQSGFKMWWQGELSNYDYLLILNRLAGRRWGDRRFHTVMPWVLDFSVRPDETSDAGWRDLTKSKWRLAKGDEQLDFTYATAEIPHHVSDECLSELAVCIYKARRLPLFVLRRTVRSVYEPNEYPVSMQRLYHWTPDECIPEFYSDTSVFSSIHSGMSDLAVPSWAENAEDFISWHRAALEGDRVSKQLHHWIDLTFGYMLSGEAAVAAKNVTLSAANPSLPRSLGRRQLFSRPHPKRQHCQMKNSSLHSSLNLKDKWKHVNETGFRCLDTAVLKTTSCIQTMSIQTCGLNTPGLELPTYAADDPISTLENLEQAVAFCETARHLSPSYKLNFDMLSGSLQVSESSDLSGQTSSTPASNLASKTGSSPEFDQKILCGRLESLKVEGTNEGIYQDFLFWQSRPTQNKVSPQGASDDIFAVGCILAEIYLRKPLFDPVSIEAFARDGVEPGLLQQLPVHVQSLVKATLERNPGRQVSAARLLESPFFPPTVRAVHCFLSPLTVLASQQSRLEYVAKLASQGAFLLMGPLAAAKCISSCLSLLVLPCENIPVEACMEFFRASLVALKPDASKVLLVPAIQKLLQGQESSVIKFAILQTPFMRDLRKAVGTAVYLQHVHFSVLATLQQSSEDGPAAAASHALIETCQELGVPITINQTIMPLLQHFGRDITIYGIETLVGIGEQLGEWVVVKHILPSLRTMITSCLHLSTMDKSGPAQSWRMLAMVDAVTVLEGLLTILSPTTILVELVQEPHNVYTKLLLHPKLSSTLLQCAAKALLSICECIGPESTAVYVLPQLQQLFNELAFDATPGEKNTSELGQHRRSPSLGSLACLDGSPHYLAKEETSESSTDYQIRGIANVGHMSKVEGKNEVRMSLVYNLYCGFASLLGIERLRQCLTTWLILEQILLKHYNWKWEGRGGAQQRTPEKGTLATNLNTNSAAEVSPTTLLLNEIGWSVPQPQSNKIKVLNTGEGTGRLNLGFEAGLDEGQGPWLWVPSIGDAWESADYLNRPGLGFGMGKDERPWKLKATIIHSWHAHPGSMKAVAVGDGENTVFTAGVGARMRGLVRQWKLSTAECIMDYTGHEEAVNDICILPRTERAVSCDGTIHLWSVQTGERITVFSESTGAVSSLSTIPVENIRVLNTGIVSTTRTGSSNGMLSAGFHGSLYTSMHLLEAEERLVAGTGNGHVRFIDVSEGRYLHSWRCDPWELSLSGLVSAIGSSGEQSNLNGRYPLSSSWIAMGFSSGQCRLLDLRTGSIVAYWRAHEGFITKLVSFEDHFLISSSLDKTLSLWDLRRSIPAQMQVFRGHSDGISSFALWSNNLLSAGGNKIGVSSLSISPQQGQERQTIKRHKLYSADLASRSLSSITTISVLPFSRFFLVGTEDGSLKVCK